VGLRWTQSLNGALASLPSREASVTSPVPSVTSLLLMLSLRRLTDAISVNVWCICAQSTCCRTEDGVKKQSLFAHSGFAADTLQYPV
jgi:hypothetical protein